MIALTSHRPHHEPGEHRMNQVRAFNSWKPVFKRIVYFGKMEPDLQSDITEFQEHEPWPRIRDLIQFAMKQPEITAIVNADIILTSRMLLVAELMGKKGFQAAVSRRYNVDARNPDFKNATANDYGLDIFVATQKAWKKAFFHCPQQLRVGHLLWDTWLIGFFNAELRSAVADFTHFKCVFHPNHEGRKAPYAGEIEHLNDKYLHSAAMPGMKLK